MGEKSKKSGNFSHIEPLSRYETNLFNRFGDAYYFFDGFEQRCSLLADLFHMNIEEENIAEAPWTEQNTGARSLRRQQP